MTKKHEALKLALENYMAAFGQGLEANGIAYGQQQVDADKLAREALTQPEPVLSMVLPNLKLARQCRSWA